ncbi:MAG: zinc ribbon domain-containing protein [Promethearchaeota archaeon]
MRHTTGITLMIIGGILMIISSTVGSIGVYEFLRDYITNEYPDLEELLNIIVNIIRFIADWGGGAIIFGAFLIILKQYRLGKWIIGIGLMFGSLALIIWLISNGIDLFNIELDPQLELYLNNIKGFFTYGTSFQFAGVAIAIIGRWFIRKPKKAKDLEIFEEGAEPTNLDSQEIKHCPNCGVPLPLNANFCNECGTDFEDR